MGELAKNIRKDLTVEFRNRYALSVALAFAAVATIAASIALAGTVPAPRVQSALLWIVVFFAAMNGLAHAFVREEEQGTALFLRLHATPHTVLTAKLAFNIALLAAIEAVAIPLFVVFLQLEVRALHSFVAIAAVGCLCLACAVTVLGAMVARAGGRGALFTVIAFPVVIPALWVLIGATARSLERPGPFDSGSVLFLLAFSGAMAGVSYLLFEHIWEE